MPTPSISDTFVLLLSQLFGHVAKDSLAAIHLKLDSIERLIMANAEKLAELQTEVQETQAKADAVLTLLASTIVSNEDLKVQLQAALDANDGEETNAAIQAAIDGLNALQTNLTAAVPPAPEPEAPAA